jgi:hypothetical protein
MQWMQLNEWQSRVAVKVLPARPTNFALASNDAPGRGGVWRP